MSSKIFVEEFSCDAGRLLLADFEGRLCACDWIDGRRHHANMSRCCKILKAQICEGSTPLTDEAKTQLREYLEEGRMRFDLPTLFAGTPFQQSVWRELLNVGYGETISYGELARRLGRRSAVRAVAGAVGCNPISIIVPCHRVIGSDGTLTGYDGGLDAKRFLLGLEHKNKP